MNIESLKGVDYLSSPYSFSGLMNEYNQLLKEENPMPFYVVEVKETLSKSIPVQASSKEDAVENVKSLYMRSLIVLDAEDYDSTEFNLTGATNEEARAAFYSKVS